MVQLGEKMKDAGIFKINYSTSNLKIDYKIFIEVDLDSKAELEEKYNTIYKLLHKKNLLHRVNIEHEETITVINKYENPLSIPSGVNYPRYIDHYLLKLKINIKNQGYQIPTNDYVFFDSNNSTSDKFKRLMKIIDDFKAFDKKERKSEKRFCLYFDNTIKDALVEIIKILNK